MVECFLIGQRDLQAWREFILGEMIKCDICRGYVAALFMENTQIFKDHDRIRTEAYHEQHKEHLTWHEKERQHLWKKLGLDRA
jgi:hypothetical protein